MFVRYRALLVPWCCCPSQLDFGVPGSYAEQPGSEPFNSMVGRGNSNPLPNLFRVDPDLHKKVGNNNHGTAHSYHREES